MFYWRSTILSILYLNINCVPNLISASIIQTQSAQFIVPQVGKFYRTKSLHPLGQPMTAAVLRDTTKETPSITLM
jgi:hypothetical protein